MGPARALVLAGDPAFSNPTSSLPSVGCDSRKSRETGRGAGLGGQVTASTTAASRRRRPFKPQRVVETRLVRSFLEAGVIVVCSGGGRSPSSAALEGNLRASLYRRPSSMAGPHRIRLSRLSRPTPSHSPDVTDADAASTRLLELRTRNRFRGQRRQRCVPWVFHGSMGPKGRGAVCRFVELTGDMVAMAVFEDAVSIIEGQSGLSDRAGPRTTVAPTISIPRFPSRSTLEEPL